MLYSVTFVSCKFRDGLMFGEVEVRINKGDIVYVKEAREGERLTVGCDRGQEN